MKLVISALKLFRQLLTWFDMVLSSNSRSAEIPGTKGVTRSAFFEVGVLDSLRAIHWD